MTREELLKIIGDYELECPNCEMPFTAKEFMINWTPQEPCQACTEAAEGHAVVFHAPPPCEPVSWATSQLGAAKRDQADTAAANRARDALARLKGELAALEEQSGQSTMFDDMKAASLQATMDRLKVEKTKLADYQATVRLRAEKEVELTKLEEKIETAKKEVETVKKLRDSLIGPAVMDFCAGGAKALEHTKDNLAVRTDGSFALGLESEIEGFRDRRKSLSGGESHLFDAALASVLHGKSKAPVKLLLADDLERITPAADQCDYLKQLGEMVDSGQLDQVVVAGACLFEYDCMTDEEKAFIAKYRERILSYGYSIIELDGRGEMTDDGADHILKTTYRRYAND